MPELPDIAVYIDRLVARIVGHRLEAVRLLNPFLLRTAVPPIASTTGRTVQGIERVGKRVVLALDGDLFVVIHLMIAGRLLWLPKGKTTARNALAFFEFDSGTLALTEAGSKRRASLHHKSMSTRQATATRRSATRCRPSWSRATTTSACR